MGWKIKPICSTLGVLMLYTVLEASAQVVKKPVQITSARLDSYSGRFAASQNFILTFSNAGDHLNLSIPGQPTIVLLPESQTKFYIKEDPEITVEFVAGSNGQVNEVIMTQGRQLVAKRIGNEAYDPLKQYSVEQLKADFNFLRSTLEKVHPRLYEFTNKVQVDHLFDSLHRAIDQPMNEIEFRYFLLPVIAKIHCGHTTLQQSIQFSQYRPSLLPPFTLYYEGKKAFVLSSAVASLTPGTEVLEINGMSANERINELLKRVTGDGIHLNVQYFLLNKPMSWFSYEIPFWFNVSDYKLRIINSDQKATNLTVKSIDMPQFIKSIPPPAPVRNELQLLAGRKTAILRYPRLDFPTDSMRDKFLATTFNNLKGKGIRNLVIDLRGNGGGKPDNAVALLKYLMKKDFIYSKTLTVKDAAHLTQLTKVHDNRYKGNQYYLIDAGCFSSTGHLLSLVQYYKLGNVFGELASTSYSSNTNGFPYPLPNSNLVLNCPDGIYETAVTGFKRADGIVPDHIIDTSFEDVLKRTDRTLNFVLSLIK
ncbi:MAG TPA: S41 family peptidase [Sphingobacteriaceae bacterium]